MAHQANDLKTAFAADGADWKTLRIDGGMVANDWIAQDLADMLDVAVERPCFSETTALGAAMLAGVGIGLFKDLKAASAMRGKIDTFRADVAADARQSRLDGWAAAVKSVLASAH
jgi:glycerol kinase